MTNFQETIQRRLLDFGANTSDPRWSSQSLEEMFTSVVSDGGCVGDVFQVLYPLVGQAHLSAELATFNKDLAMCAFSKFQENYHASDLGWLRTAVEQGCTPAQAYLALYTLPPEVISPKCVLSILQALAGTPFWSEAIANLEEEAESENVQHLLSEWLAAGVDPNCRADLERLTKIDST